jgi:hypothetical protein
VIYSSGTSVDFQQTTRRYIPEDSTLHQYLLDTNIYSKYCFLFWGLKLNCTFILWSGDFVIDDLVRSTGRHHHRIKS